MLTCRWHFEDYPWRAIDADGALYYYKKARPYTNSIDSWMAKDMIGHIFHSYLKDNKDWEKSLQSIEQYRDYEKTIKMLRDNQLSIKNVKLGSILKHKMTGDIGIVTLKSKYGIVVGNYRVDEILIKAWKYVDKETE